MYITRAAETNPWPAKHTSTAKTNSSVSSGAIATAALPKFAEN